MYQYTDLDYQIINLIKAYGITSTLGALSGGRLVFGGVPGPSGGYGGPWAGIIGQLPQKKVCLDTTELASVDIPISGSSLLDNLNRIRSGIVIRPITATHANYTVTGSGSLIDYLDGIDTQLGSAGHVIVSSGGTEFPHRSHLKFDTDLLVQDSPGTDTTIVSALIPSGTSGGHVIIDQNDNTMTQRTKLQFRTNLLATDDSADDKTIVDALGSGTTPMYVNQTVTPAPGSGVSLFTVSKAKYEPDSLIVAVNGQVQVAAVDFVEVSPAAGTFQFASGSVPDAGDLIRAFHGLYAGISARREVGELTMWLTDTPPPKWLICDGSAISRTTYADLFAILGTSFGAGNGSTTFNIPDMRERVPYGKAAAGSIPGSGGTSSVTLTTTQMPTHTHTGRLITRSTSLNTDYQVPEAGDATKNYSLLTYTTSGVGLGQPFSILPPYTIVNYIIYTGV